MNEAENIGHAFHTGLNAMGQVAGQMIMEHMLQAQANRRAERESRWTQHAIQAAANRMAEQDRAEEAKAARQQAYGIAKIAEATAAHEAHVAVVKANAKKEFQSRLTIERDEWRVSRAEENVAIQNQLVALMTENERLKADNFVTFGLLEDAKQAARTIVSHHERTIGELTDEVRDLRATLDELQYSVYFEPETTTWQPDDPSGSRRDPSGAGGHPQALIAAALLARSVLWSSRWRRESPADVGAAA